MYLQLTMQNCIKALLGNRFQIKKNNAKALEYLNNNCIRNFESQNSEVTDHAIKNISIQSHFKNVSANYLNAKHYLEKWNFQNTYINLLDGANFLDIRQWKILGKQHETIIFHMLNNKFGNQFKSHNKILAKLLVNFDKKYNF